MWWEHLILPSLPFAHRQGTEWEGLLRMRAFDRNVFCQYDPFLPDLYLALLPSLHSQEMVSLSSALLHLDRDWFNDIIPRHFDSGSYDRGYRCFLSFYDKLLFGLPAV